MMKTLGMFEKDKDALKLALEEVVLILRDSIALKSGAVNCLSRNRETANELASSMTTEKIIKASAIVNDALQGMQYYANHNLLLARLSSQLKD